jgi:hypothetical protein
MKQVAENSVASGNVTSLLSHYGFESEGLTVAEVVELWKRDYPSRWVHLATIEALYQGRYKTISVEQILTTWKRRGHPIYHFNHEFERLVSRKVPQKLKELCFRKPRPSLSASAPSNRPEPLDQLAIASSSYINELASPEPSEDSFEYISDYIEEVRSYPPNSPANLIPLPDSIEELSRRTIGQFTPTPDRSDVYLKLMALSTEG